MWNSLGQDDAIKLFSFAKSENRLAHAYLFVGPNGVGKTTLAEDFTRFLFCENENRPCGNCVQCKRVISKIHTDLHWIESGKELGEGESKTKSIGIERIREIRTAINIKPFEARQRIIIISRSEDMTLAASNALLKVLEEPPKNVFFLLLTSNLSMMIPTIISRCQRINIRQVSDEFIQQLIVDRYHFAAASALEIARLASGKIGLAIFIAENPGYLGKRLEVFETIEELLKSGLEKRFQYSERLARDFLRDPDKVRNELNMWEIWWRDLMLVKLESSELVFNSSKIEDFLEFQSRIEIGDVINLLKTIEMSMELLRRNVNPRLVLDQLVLETPVITSM